jgi:hypothetical protein
MRRFAIAGGLVLGIAMAVGSQTASAVTIGPHTRAATAEDSLVQLAQFPFPYCRFVRRECAERWGWGTRRFYRCLERRGCLDW